MNNTLNKVKNVNREILSAGVFHDKCNDITIGDTTVLITIYILSAFSVISERGIRVKHITNYHITNKLKLSKTKHT